MARYKPDQKEQTRERIVDAAGRCFRKGGYSGIGVDGLAKEAGVTSGAFYGHFDSKLAAFSAAIVSGLNQVRVAVGNLQQEYGKDWWSVFTKFYTTKRRTCDLAESCALQSLTPEVGRSEAAIRAIFETELLKIVNLATDGVSQTTGQEARDRTWASLAMLVGGVTLARAVADQKLSDEIGEAIQKAVIAMQKSE